MRQFWKSNKWKYLIAFLLPVFLVTILTPGLDNDSWYVLAEGRQIVEHGVYYVDELSMHEDLAVTVQNYGFAVIFWLTYSMLGPAGLYLGMILLFMGTMWLIYKICLLISNKNVNLSLILTFLTGVLLTYGFVVTRAQMVDYLLIAGLIYVLELYVKTGKRKILWIIPVISLAMINLHAASWWMLFFVMGAYLVDGIRKPKLRLSGYGFWPILIVMLVAMTVGLINPYGVKAITMIFTSYVGLKDLGFIQELKAFEPMNAFGIVYFIAIAIVIWLYVFGKRNIRARHLLMFLGFLGLGLNTIKGMSELALVMFFPLALMYKDLKIPVLIDNAKVREMMVSWAGIVVTMLNIGSLGTVVLQLEDYPRRTLAEAMNTIDKEAGGRGDLKIYAFFNNGGYVEFRGYKPYLDPRAEVFLKRNNRKADILKEYLDSREDGSKMQELIDKYDFDFLLVEEGESIWDLKDEEYELVYDSDDDRVYRKVKT